MMQIEFMPLTPYFSMCSSTKSISEEGQVGASATSNSTDNLQADGGGRVVSGKYVPTKDEIIHHEQVKSFEFDINFPEKKENLYTILVS